jgi:hypothetical protein
VILVAFFAIVLAVDTAGIRKVVTFLFHRYSVGVLSVLSRYTVLVSGNFKFRFYIQVLLVDRL